MGGDQSFPAFDGFNIKYSICELLQRKIIKPTTLFAIPSLKNETKSKKTMMLFSERIAIDWITLYTNTDRYKNEITFEKSVEF